MAAIMYAYMAVDEAEVAVLEAIAARAYADLLAWSESIDYLKSASID